MLAVRRHGMAALVLATRATVAEHAQAFAPADRPFLGLCDIVNLGLLRVMKRCYGEIANAAITQFTAWQLSAAYKLAHVLAGQSGFDLG